MVSKIFKYFVLIILFLTTAFSWQLFFIKDSFTINLKKADKLFNEKRFKEASQLYEKIVEESKSKSKNSYILFQIGRCFYELDRLDYSIRYF